MWRWLAAPVALLAGISRDEARAAIAYTIVKWWRPVMFTAAAFVVVVAVAVVWLSLRGVRIFHDPAPSPDRPARIVL